MILIIVFILINSSKKQLILYKSKAEIEQVTKKVNISKQSYPKIGEDFQKNLFLSGIGNWLLMLFNLYYL